MRDGIEAARRGTPSVALVTEEFWEQGNFVAKAFGMPELPRVQLPHPIAGTSSNEMRDVAERLAPVIMRALRGEV